MHTLRSFRILGTRFSGIELLNSSNEQPTYQFGLVRRRRSLIKELVRLLFIHRNRYIHIHFNNYYGILLFAFLYKNRILLTLHNRRFYTYSKLKQKLLVLAIKRIHCIFANDIQMVEDLSFLKVKVVQNEAFLPPCDLEMKAIIPESVIRFKAENKFTAAMSIYQFSFMKHDIYGIKQTIPLLEAINKTTSFGIILVVSNAIPNDELNAYMAELNSRNLGNKILLLEKPDIPAFHIWKQCHLFLRLNNSDMEGISIKESLYFNVPCIASNVCSRPENSIIYDVNHADDLIDKTQRVLSNYGHTVESLSTNNLVKERSDYSIKKIENIYSELLCDK